MFPREHQAFHGLGEKPVEFPEIESAYDDEAARREAARCYRCDAETGSSDYSVRTREDIFVMARTRPGNARKQHAVFTRRLDVAGRTHFRPEVPTLDDLVFLPANLSRLVIDPYRDACSVSARLGVALELGAPFLVAGFDDAPEPVRRAVAHGLKELGLAYLGRRPLGHHDVRWLQLLAGGDEAHPEAEAVLRIGPGGSAASVSTETSSSASPRPRRSCPGRSRSRSSTASTCSSSTAAAASAGAGPSSPGRQT